MVSVEIFGKEERVKNDFCISTPRTPARCHFCQREWWFAEGQERRCPICQREL